MEMDEKKITKLIAAGILALLVMVYTGTVMSFRSDSYAAEAGIKAQYDQNRNNYDNMWKRFREAAQVPRMQAEQTEKLFKVAIGARYGEGGSKALFQAIAEQNPHLDSAVYTQLQRSIEAGRIGFAADQKQLIDRKREYETMLKTTRGAVAGVWFNFPTIDLTKYDIVTSDQTDAAFATKKAGEIKLE